MRNTVSTIEVIISIIILDVIIGNGSKVMSLREL